MSNPTPHNDHLPSDSVEAVVPLMPIVLPIVGAVLMFLEADLCTGLHPDALDLVARFSQHRLVPAPGAQNPLDGLRTTKGIAHEGAT